MEKKYEPNDRELMAELYSLARLALHDKREDFLGAMYMDLGFSRKENGQFFTPNHLCHAMATMLLEGAKECIEQKGYFTLCEPACGAGSMVIEAANVIAEEGYNPQHSLWFQATDLSRTCFNMAYFQLSALQLCGEVIHGNSITFQQREVRKTPAWNIASFGMPETSLSQHIEPEFLPPSPSPIHVSSSALRVDKKGQLAFDF